MESKKDERRYWLELGTYIPGFRAFIQEEEGIWEPVIDQLVNSLISQL
jgi:hypothetical protein